MITPISSLNIKKQSYKNINSGNILYPKYYSSPYDKVDISFTSQKIISKNIFKKVAMFENNPKWQQAILRENPLKVKPNDMRTPFQRDYDRILYSEGHDRMRDKAQSYVTLEKKLKNTETLLHPKHDMVSTRSTHIQQVANIARRICKHLGLNEDLAEAIALGHDLGHSPFGHEGETALKEMTQKYGLELFWHEKNSLKMIDDLLTLETSSGNHKNFNLTYAVRDGIICHCGEVDQNGLKPRSEAIDLMQIEKASQYQPFSWEGCVVKVADKIAYLGRDVEDALKTGVLSKKQRKLLKEIVIEHVPDFEGEVNNSSLIDLFINDLTRNSTPEKGIGFSKEIFGVMKAVKKFNSENIYSSPKQKPNKEFFKKVLGTIFETYDELYDGKNTIKTLKKKPHTKEFRKWLIKYSQGIKRPEIYQNKTLYNLEDKQQYRQAIVDFISGMTDNYAMKTYSEFS